MPSGSSCSSGRAASSAMRVLPTPGGPVSVTMRCSRRRPATWAQLVLAADERGGGRGEVAAAPAVDRDRGDRRVVREDRLLQGAEAPGRARAPARRRARAVPRGRRRARPPGGRCDRAPASAAPTAARGRVVRERRAKHRRDLPVLSERQRASNRSSRASRRSASSRRASAPNQGVRVRPCSAGPRQSASAAATASAARTKVAVAQRAARRRRAAPRSAPRRRARRVRA